MRPILCQWDGEVMRPTGRMQAIADAQFVPGERYRLEVVCNRSGADHRHYFAWLHEAWSNLPEHLEGRWADEDALRRWALIKADFFTVHTYYAETETEADRYSASMLEQDSEVQIERAGFRVIVKRAMTQNFKSMTQRQFHDSKDKVIRVVSMLIGVTPETLKRESLRHA